MAKAVFSRAAGRRTRITAAFTIGCAMAVFAMPNPASAQEDAGTRLEAEYVADTVAVTTDAGTQLDYLALASVKANIALDALTGLAGSRLMVGAIASQGGRPNDHAGTLQGINNIEVAENRIRLFELFVEQPFAKGRGSVRLGLSDLNSEFYSTEASSLLIAPPFGIGSELSATGPNGPSIFPATALTARVRLETAGGTYLQGAVVNAETGLGGREKGSSLFGKGALFIGEAGKTWPGGLRLGLGGWTYSSRQPDLRDVDAGGDPVPRRAYGLYGIYEQRVAGGDDRNVALFARAGLSDGKTTPYSGGWQAGLLVKAPLAARPESQFSIGVHQAFLTDRFLRNAADAGQIAHRSDIGFEVTYADALAPWLIVQPDIQHVRSGAHGCCDHEGWAFTLRLRMGFTRPAD